MDMIPTLDFFKGLARINKSTNQISTLNYGKPSSLFIEPIDARTEPLKVGTVHGPVGEIFAHQQFNQNFFSLRWQNLFRIF